MNMDVDLGGFLSQNTTYDYGDYEYKEDPVSRGTEAVLLPVVYSLVLVVGLLGNGLLLAVLAQKRRSWSVSDTFILHLAAADILLLVTLPLWAAQAAKHHGQRIGDVLCKISGAVFHMNFFCGIFLMTCVSLDRFLSIVRHTQLSFFKRTTLAHVSCLFFWVVSLLLTIPDWVYLTADGGAAQQEARCVHSYAQPGCHRQLVSRLCHHILGFLLPAAILIFCCARILMWLQQKSKNLRKQTDIMVYLPLVAVFFLFWMPYNVTLIVDTFTVRAKQPQPGSSLESMKTALMVTSVFGCVHACLRPLLYLGLCRNFRKRSKALARCVTEESTGSLWELGVGKETQPEQGHEVQAMKQLLSVEHQVQSTQQS